MSRIGKKPIESPQGVEIKIQPGEVIVKGQKGEIKQEIPIGILVEQKENVILVKPERSGKNIPALWGLTAFTGATCPSGDSITISFGQPRTANL